MNINWNKFIDTLSAEYIKNNKKLTEGLIRYWFSEGIKFSVKDLVIESNFTQHNTRPSPPLKPVRKNPSHIDLYFKDGLEEYVVEFKYGIGTNETEIAGEAFNDMNRLSVRREKQKYFVFIFDSCLDTYFANILNGCFYIPTGKKSYLIDSTFTQWKNKNSFPPAFYKKAFKSFLGTRTDFQGFNYKIDRIIAQEIPNNNQCLIVYKVS